MTICSLNETDTQLQEDSACRFTGDGRAQDLTGQQFGLLTAVSYAGRRNYRSLWRCRCACGGEKIVSQTDLLSGNVRSCGCQARRHPVSDLAGKQFGNLTALAYAGKKNGCHSWLCRCTCGREVVVAQARLLDGSRTDCGCTRTRKSTDLTGQKFGRLTVTGDAGVQGRVHHWKCVCACGNEVTVTQNHLLQGLTKSCGCLRSTIGIQNLELVGGTSLKRIGACRGKLTSSNTSGYNGVYEQNSHGKKTGRWVAQIGFQGKNYFLGSFATKEAAAQARREAEERIYDGFLAWYHDRFPSERSKETEDQ